MRVRKRNGAPSRSTSTRSCARSSRCCGRPRRRRPDARRHQDDQRPLRRRDHRASSTSCRSRPPPALIVEEPQYSRLAARLLATYIDKEVRNQDIHSFSQSIALGARRRASIDDATAPSSSTPTPASSTTRSTPSATASSSTSACAPSTTATCCAHPTTRLVIETPQYFFLRVACGLSRDGRRGASSFYRLISSLEYLPSSPTLFNSGTAHPQMSSCFLLDSPEDDLEAIYERYTDVALLSKFSGGIGLAYHRVAVARLADPGHQRPVQRHRAVAARRSTPRSRRSTRAASARAPRCVYLEPWHADIEEFLELRDNTGDEARRTHNLNLANWIPDLFMRAGRGGRAVVAVRPEGACPSSPTCTARSSTRRTSRPRPTGATSRQVQGARALRADDAHAGRRPATAG